MCGVTVVDACRSRSTNLGCDAYIMIIALDIVIIIQSSINCPKVICLPTICYFSREKPLVKSYGPGVYSLSYLLWDLFLFAFIFRSIIPKTQKYPAELFYNLFYFAFYRELFIHLPHIYLSFYRGGIDNPSCASGCKYLFFVCRHRLLTVAWFSYWIDTLVS